jgi:drug/metabolite transporter (DMT)-like permease
MFVPAASGCPPTARSGPGSRSWALLNNLVPFTLIAWGQTHIDSGLASIINATTPLFTVLVAHVLTADERMTAGRLAGVALGLAGVVVLIGPSAPGGVGAGVAGELAVLAAAVSYAFAGVYGRRLGGLPPAVAAAGMLICSSVMVAPLALAVDGLPQAVPAPSVLAAILAIAVLSTALAYILYFRILAAAGATNLLLVTFLIPVTAILFGVVLLGERLGLSALAGMALIFAGPGLRRRPGARLAAPGPRRLTPLPRARGLRVPASMAGTTRAWESKTTGMHTRL